MFAVVELSLYVPVAVNCSVAPLAIDGLAGVTAIEARRCRRYSSAHRLET